MHSQSPGRCPGLCATIGLTARPKAKYKPYLLVELCAKCLEGTTERIDSNQGRSPRIDKAKYKKSYSLVGYALSAWKALLSEAMVTGDEVLG